MADCFTPKRRSEIMGLIRSRGNRTTELRLVRIMRRYKIKGWRRGSKLPGRPDFVFPRSQVAVFVDGDFWHGNPRKKRLPKSNTSYWQEKIRSNRARDRKINRALKALGWRVVRIWESSLRDEEAVAARLRLLL
ncbi:MAG: very short patch repair endonuclease [Planctomycetia bacterium]|nr:very short patch repair endonuclease [Planctomycetia bacterium]